LPVVQSKEREKLSDAEDGGEPVREEEDSMLFCPANVSMVNIKEGWY
jgi:hypothetical protein